MVLAPRCHHNQKEYRIFPSLVGNGFQNVKLMFTERPFFRTLQIMAASLLALFADSASQFATCMGHIGKVDVIYVYIYICTDLGLPSKSL